MVTIQLEEETSEKSTVSTERAIKTPTSGDTEIQLWSATGLIKTYKTEQKTYQIPVSDLPKGIYFVRVIKDGKTYTQKLLKN